MKEEELYEDLQGAKVAFALTVLVLIYCYSEMINFCTAHEQLKAICSIAGFLIVTIVTAHLLMQIIDLRTTAGSISESPEQPDNS